MANLNYLSFTGWKTYVTCPEQYKNQYVLKLRPPMEDMVNVIKGQCLHDLMEGYLLNKEDDPNWIIEHSGLYWDKGIKKVKDDGNIITWKSPSDPAAQKEKYMTWAADLSLLFKTYKLNPLKIYPEFKADCHVTMGPHRFKMGGRIDILLQNKKGDYVIMDLKGSERSAVVVKDQITWYGILTELFFSEEKMKVTHGAFLLPGFSGKSEKTAKFQMFEISEKAKEKLRNEIIAVISGIKADEFKPSPESNKCWWCPVKPHCSLYKLKTGSADGMFHLG